MAGTAVTLGQDPDFPQTSTNPRDIIQLGWGSGTGLANAAGHDLAIYEAATSEAFGVRLQVAGTAWTGWRYTPYQRPYDTLNDATLTLIEFDDFGVAGSAIVTALEITNLLVGDTVDTLIVAADLNPDGLGSGNLTFDGSGPYSPGRFSSSQGVWVPFEDTKFDPDIQYVVGLHSLSSGAFATSSPASYSLPLSPRFAAATVVPVPPSLVLLVPGLAWALRRATRTQGHDKGLLVRLR